MTTKTMRVVLEIKVSDLSEEDRLGYASYENPHNITKDGEVDSPLIELPTLDSYTAKECARPINEFCNPDYIRELFAGNDLYIQYEEAKVVSAEFVEEQT